LRAVDAGYELDGPAGERQAARAVSRQHRPRWDHQATARAAGGL